MLNKSTIGLLVFALAAITTTFGEVVYFNSHVHECFEGSVTITEDNIALLDDNCKDSCKDLGLNITTCPKDTYGCFISSSKPSQAPQFGDTLFFGCGERKSCDETPGYNCCTHDNCNCYEYEDIECDEDRKRRDDGGDSGVNSSTMGFFD